MVCAGAEQVFLFVVVVFFLNDGSTSQAARGRAAAAASGVPEQPGVGVVMGTHLM